MDFTLTPAQHAFQERVRDLARKHFAPRAAEYDEKEQWPAENVAELTRQGLMGMTVAPEYGGRSASLLELVLAVEEIAKVCVSTARIVVDSNVGAVGVIERYGNEAQRQRFLPMITAGDKPAVSITEPKAGSAATHMTSHAVRRGEHYVLNGTKWFITGAEKSHVYVVFCRFPEDGDVIGALVVEKGTTGFTFGPRIPTMGVRALYEGELVFTDCLVPVENRIQPPGGFKDLISAYNAQRVGAAAVALGVAQEAFDLAVAHSRQREQFGRPIGEFQGLQWNLVDMNLKLDCARMMLYRAAAEAGSGLPDPVLAAKAKLLAATAAVDVTNGAMQVFGSYGYSRRLPLERMVRDARMFTIGGGTVEMLKNLVGRHLYKG